MIQARVIRIISKKQLIFNAGAADGVRRGQKFYVLTPPITITDPTTGEALGDYQAHKILIEPDRVFDRFTIASPPGMDHGDFEPDDEYWPDLPVDPATIEPLSSEVRVSVGDLVEQIPDPIPSQAAPSPFPPAAADDDIPF